MKVSISIVTTLLRMISNCISFTLNSRNTNIPPIIQISTSDLSHFQFILY